MRPILSCLYARTASPASSPLLLCPQTQVIFLCLSFPSNPRGLCLGFSQAFLGPYESISRKINFYLLGYGVTANITASHSIDPDNSFAAARGSIPVSEGGVKNSSIFFIFKELIVK